MLEGKDARTAWIQITDSEPTELATALALVMRCPSVGGGNMKLRSMGEPKPL